jgi:hypothetical protein
MDVAGGEMAKLKEVALLLFTVLLAGCATTPSVRTFRVEVDAINNGGAVRDKSYYFAPADSAVNPSDLTYLEYAKIIERALLHKGYVRKEKPREAALVIAIAYGIGEPRQNIYSFSVPVYGQTGIASSYTIGNATSYTPSYGVTGYSSRIGTYTTYRRYVLVMAYDNRAKQLSGRDVQLWKTDITSTGSSGDLRFVFPYMIAAAIPYFGENTQTRVAVDVDENSPVALELRGEPGPNQAPVTPAKK